MNRTITAAAVGAALALGGCATTGKMALSKDAAGLELGQQSLVLMTMRLGNTYKPDSQPKLRAVSIRAEEGERATTSFEIGELIARDESQTNQFEEAAFSFPLPPGRYQMREVSVYTPGIFAPGSGTVPIFARFEVKPGQVVYLGRIEAVRRERKDDAELRAGSVVPLIPQAVSGYSGGTFDVKIRDAYESDLKLLRDSYPALQKAQVAKSVLPDWKKPSDADME
jgi:hypothetical protein